MRASGRGEAVWACERGVFVNAGPQNGEMSSGPGCDRAVLVAICKGFKEKAQILLLYVRVLRKSFQFIAIRKGFKEILSIYCYTQGF